MSTKKFYSKRLEQEFELEVCTALPGQIEGDDSDISIVRASALEKLFNDLGGAVSWKWSEVEDKGIIIDINDDTGVHVAGIGDWDEKSLVGRIAQSYPLSTAWSRAMSNAIVKYFGFEGRIYTDASFAVEDDETLPVPTKRTKSVVKEKPTSTETASVTTEAETEAEPINNLGSAKWPYSKLKGKTLDEIAVIDEKEPYFTYVKKREGCTYGTSYLLYMYESKKAPESLMPILKEYLAPMLV